MKIFRRITAVIMLACIMLTLTGCGHKIVDTWKLTGGNAVQAITSLSGSAQLVTSEAEALFTFDKEGNLTISMKRDDISTEINAGWAEDDDNIILTINGASVKCSYAINGDELTLFFTLDGQNANLVFARK